MHLGGGGVKTLFCCAILGGGRGAQNEKNIPFFVPNNMGIWVSFYGNFF